MEENMEALELKFRLTNCDEIEVEADPNTILEDALKQMVEAGPLSPGLVTNSFSSPMVRIMGRIFF